MDPEIGFTNLADPQEEYLPHLFGWDHFASKRVVLTGPDPLPRVKLLVGGNIFCGFKASFQGIPRFIPRTVDSLRRTTDNPVSGFPLQFRGWRDAASKLEAGNGIREGVAHVKTVRNYAKWGPPKTDTVSRAHMTHGALQVS